LILFIGLIDQLQYLMIIELADEWIDQWIDRLMYRLINGSN